MMHEQAIIARINNMGKDSVQLWTALVSTSNKVSRKAFLANFPSTGLKVTSPQKDWLAVLDALENGRLSRSIEELKSKREEERKIHEAEYETRGLLAVIERGKRWKLEDHSKNIDSLELVKYLQSAGYTIEKTGIGTVKFVKGHSFFGPFRSKELNAAIKLIDIGEIKQ
jgi:hypothetical protein